MVIIFCGIPGAGKTATAKKLSGRLKRFGRTKVFISDELKPPVYEKFFGLIKENAGKYDFLVFDATFYKSKWRQKIKSLAKGDRFLVIYLFCSLKTAIERNKKRRTEIAEKAIHIIFNRMEKPRNPDIAINTEKTSVADSVKKIFEFILKKAKIAGLAGFH